MNLEPRMRPTRWFSVVGLTVWMALAPAALAQPRPYIGFLYPAGGQQGATVEVRLGGQGLDGVHAALVTGSSVSAKVVECLRRLNNQEVQLLNEQLKELKRATSSVSSATPPRMISESDMTTSMRDQDQTTELSGNDDVTSRLIARIEKRTREFVQTPACAAIATVTVVEVVIAPDAEPGQREIRLVTPRGVSNPLAFHVGQLPEFTRKPMLTTRLHVLGKEAQSLRKRPSDEVEKRVAAPCIVNGQVGPGEVNRYRFEARRGQQLVISTQARQLVPFIADAVPGWFQPVLALRDKNDRDVAYADDYRFNPDPTILYSVTEDGEYVLAIHDSIYRGREDFVYRITIGETPFVTSIFPLGGQAGQPVAVKMRGWNLDQAELRPPAKEAEPGTHWLTATRNGFHSNPVPFALDTLPECNEQPSNDNATQPRKVTLPIIVNGRVDHTDDWDVFAFAARSNDTIVAEVEARRLNSPLDSVIKLTSATGAVLAFNDDFEDLTCGENTHQADSYFMARLPADGTYYVHIGDAARNGGEEYGYRLRISEPRPDFALRVVPSSLGLRGGASATATVYAQRKDGFNGPIRLALKDPPSGFSSPPVTLGATQTMARLTVRSSAATTEQLANLSIVGSARFGPRTMVREAVPAEDRMQAFLWRHLVPAGELKVLAFNPTTEPRSGRFARTRPRPSSATNAAVAAKGLSVTNAASGTNANLQVASASGEAAKPKFTRQQIAGRLRQLRLLFEDGLLTDAFYGAKVAECEVGSSPSN